MMVNIEERWHVVRRNATRLSSGFLAVALASTLMLGVTACGSSESNSQASSSTASEQVSDSESGAVETTSIDESLYDLEYSKRDKDPSYDAAEASTISLNGSSAQSSSDSVEVKDSTVSITAEGVYIVNGELADGQLVVSAPEDAKVQIVLDDAAIHSSNGSAIYVEQADKCFITLAEGTSNEVSDASSYSFEGDETEPDAAIFSTCDLTLQGTGSLNVSGNYNDAVKTKDDLVITGGSYAIEAQGDGLVGKDSVKIADGTLSVTTTEGDAIKSSKDDDVNKGFVTIDGGDITVSAGDKGVKAETYLRVTGGELDVTAADDGLHCDGCGRIAGGNVAINAGDDGFHVDYVLEVNGGMVDIAKSYEGLEGQTITINDGDVHVVASDDGFNASSGNSGVDEAGFKDASDGDSHWNMQGNRGNAPDMPGGGMPQGDMPEGQAPQGDAPEPPSGSGQGQAPGGQMPSGQGGAAPSSSSADGATQDGNSFDGPGDMGGGFGGGGMMDSDESCVITINGGTIEVDAGGDGIDSNGAIVLNGGTVYVSGPTSNGDGALDCGTTITSNGGTLIAAGSSGMAESFTDGTQAFGQVNLNGSAGDEILVKDASGNVIASYAPTKTFQNVVVTVEGMVDGSTYTVSAGSSSAEFTASTEGSSAGMGGGFGGGMGGRGGQGGGRPDGDMGGAFGGGNGGRQQGSSSSNQNA